MKDVKQMINAYHVRLEQIKSVIDKRLAKEFEFLGQVEASNVSLDIYGDVACFDVVWEGKTFEGRAHVYYQNWLIWRGWTISYFALYYGLSIFDSIESLGRILEDEKAGKLVLTKRFGWG